MESQYFASPAPLSLGRNPQGEAVVLQLISRPAWSAASLHELHSPARVHWTNAPHLRIWALNRARFQLQGCNKYLQLAYTDTGRKMWA